MTKLSRFMVKNKLVVFTLVFGLIGLLLVLITNAASPYSIAEIENASLSGGATRISDSTASGGSVVRFNSPTNGTNPPVTTGQRCSVLLHGANADPNTIAADRIKYNNDPALTSIGVKTVVPFSGYWADFIGNFWPYDGPHNFQYDPNSTDDEVWYQQYLTLVRNEITQAGCGPTYLEGGSNGGAFVAKMFCRGEDFGGRVWGVYMKDPVMDTGVLNCNPSNNIKKAVVGYSDELADQIAPSAGDNYRCRSTPWSWYCNDDTTMTVAQYTQRINAHGKLEVPVYKIARKHIYDYYPIADQLHIGFGTIYGDWWRYYYNQ